MEALFRLLPGPQPIAIRYGVTTVIVLAAFAVRLGIGDATGRFGFIHFVLPVMAAALLFDRGTGFYAVALSAALVSSVVSWSDVNATLTAIAVFALVGSCVVFVSEGLHKALVTAHAAQRATDLLLQEMSHRVKNKFAMVGSIISLQARSSSPEVQAALEDVASRVQIIATVHNYLQLSRHEGLIDMSEYVPGLCKALREALCGPRPIAVSSQAVAAKLPSEKALATGLIINELITNAFKYAFPNDRPGIIKVDFAQIESDFVLTVADTAVGCAEGSTPGLGTRLVSVFAAQLGGSATWEGSPEGGCRAAVRFPRQGG